MDAKGDYAGEASAGRYLLIYRMPDTPPSLFIDSISNVVIDAGKDLRQDDDMSRQAFIDELPDEQKKELEDLKKQNAAAQGQEALIKTINADLAVASQNLKESDAARTAAVKELGKAADPAEIDTKAAEIKSAKCAAVESHVKDLQSIKESGLSAAESTLWENLGRAQVGLKKYDEARSISRFSKFKRSRKSQEAAQAFANADEKGSPPPGAEAAELDLSPFQRITLRYFSEKRGPGIPADRRCGSAGRGREQAIKADPKDALAYYIKAKRSSGKGIHTWRPGITICLRDALRPIRSSLSLAPSRRLFLRGARCSVEQKGSARPRNRRRRRTMKPCGSPDMDARGDNSGNQNQRCRHRSSTGCGAAQIFSQIRSLGRTSHRERIPISMNERCHRPGLEPLQSSSGRSIYVFNGFSRSCYGHAPYWSTAGCGYGRNLVSSGRMRYSHWIRMRRCSRWRPEDLHRWRRRIAA